MPRRLLDPRRHRGKPSAEEESLELYQPVIPDELRMVISHGYTVRRAVTLSFHID